MRIAVVLTVLVMVFASFTVAFQAGGQEHEIKVPVEEAATWAPLLPMKNLFLVKYDPESYTDDYAYMAAVPSAVFYDHQDAIVYASPLLYWEPSRGLTGENLPQDSVVGVDYFMADWLNYSDMQLHNAQYINMDDSEVSDVNDAWQLNASTSKVYARTDPYSVAKDIALYNWRSADTAVIAVISTDFPEMDELTEGSVDGVLPGQEPEIILLQGEKEPSPIKPNVHTFTIAPDFKYVTSQMEWYGPTGSDNLNSITQRGRDPDLQLYDMELGEVAASEEWNVLSGVGEYVGSYVYNEGQWASAVTYMPTKDMAALNDVVGKDPSKLPKLYDADGSRNLQGPSKPGSKVVYEITNTMYPGTDVDLPVETPFMAKDGSFTLSWSGSANLGLLIRGPSDAVIAEDLGEGNPKTLTVKDLGQGNYSVTAIRLTGGSESVAFNVSYSWHQYHTEAYGSSMASAAEGSVLASLKNVPLLYATPKGLPKATKKAIDTLGVKNVIVVDIDGVSKGRVSKAVSGMRSWLEKMKGQDLKVDEITEYYDIYSRIKTITDNQYVVFTTIDPYSYWAVGAGPVGEEPKGLFIGPAAYSGALHGCPVFITDVDPTLSTSVAWNNAYWVDAYAGRYPPSVGSMVLTGRAVYDVLDQYDYDDAGMEYMMTVADQFDIGMSWDRTFVGAAVPGRIMGTPIDTAYWIARSALYTAMIFANPGTNPGGTWMNTGSSSKFYNGVLQTEPEHEINAVYPVVQTWVSYQHRFNERGSLYWGADYVTADGIVPYRSVSGNDIDLDNKWPDLTTSEIVPHYSKKAGYTPVYSSNFDATMTNLNKGSLLWLEVMHGGNSGSGVVGFWNPDQIEPNPWRGYESGGSTFEPDTVIMGKNIGLDLLRNPTRSDRFHDGVIIAIVEQSQQTSSNNGYDFDNAMENMHSMGFNGGSCLIANTYMHMTMVRHGMVFQVIDPWLTSWYATFAMEAWLRDMVLGYSVGEAYQHGIQHVGIQYLIEQWWWDIFENVVYFGDPAIRVYMPVHAWVKPVPMSFGSEIGGHTPHGSPNHPNKFKSMYDMEMAIYVAVAVGIGAMIGVITYKAVTRPKKPKKAKVGKGAGKASVKTTPKTIAQTTSGLPAGPLAHQKAPPKAPPGKVVPPKSGSRWSFGGTGK